MHQDRDYSGLMVELWVLLSFPGCDSIFPFVDFPNLAPFLTPVTLLNVKDSTRTIEKSRNCISIALAILERYHTTAGSVTCTIPSPSQRPILRHNRSSVEPIVESKEY